MEKKLQGKVALVTGASRGIGRAISVTLAGAGAQLVLVGRAPDALAETAGTIEQAGGKALIVPTELTDEDSIVNLVDAVKSKLGRLDILINNAGITCAAPMEKTSTEDYDRCMATNARGPYLLCRESLDLLRRAPQGYIVNISSVVGVKGYANQTAYTASKHALRGMSIALAEELRPDNIRVHVICPGGVLTDMVQRVRPDIRKDELIKPQEIAELVLYLVTHEGNAVIDELHIRRATSTPWF